MTIMELLSKTDFKLLTPDIDINGEIEGAFVGDLLSWVMGNSEPKQAWVTVQAHSNVIAVAALREFSCVIICQGAIVGDDIVAMACEEKIPLITTDKSAFEVCGSLVDLGL